MTIDVRLLAALNVGYTDQEVIELIEGVAQAIEDGHVYAESYYDEITSLHLTAAGRAAWPVSLPAASA
jgi:hypothetical protein